jgi:hydrogenase maturation protein HypF
MVKKRLFIIVKGIVQGVGFRPFVYNLAISNNLTGWVNNNSEGVYIDVEGDEILLNILIKELNENPPPLSLIENISIEEKALNGYDKFIIRESYRQEEKITLISPDISICDKCKEDIFDPTNRRYFYPFTNCTNCGPRYSIIKDIPYDRDKTTMKSFKMCKLCENEYKDPLNRRFHAQPNACDDCGPQLYLKDNLGNDIFNNSLLPKQSKSLANKEIIKWTQKKLKEGYIFAIKGLSGFHLVCDGENTSAIELLRNRKNRPHKPFAVMMNDIDTIKKYCKVDMKEFELLKDIRKPIVLLEKNSNFSLPENIAPAQNTLGVMLPYTPLHELIFLMDIKVLIMTSANLHGLPLEYKNDSALKNLGHIADYFLMHNRDIHIPVDDSVVKVISKKPRLIRRARGYAPEPIKFEGIQSIFACGSNMKNTTCIAKEDFLFLSPHNGDLENIETYEHYKNNIEHFKKVFAFTPKYLAADMHPDYYSTQYAHSTELPVLEVQHHHAHIVSCMVENKVNTKIIGIAFDGTGYGVDGKIWGGEFLICDYKNFNRAAHLAYVKMPGREKAITEPWRMGVSYMYEANLKDINIISHIFGIASAPIIQMLEKNINCIETSSMGRLFDAVSSILNICRKVTYEGQASMELEAIIDGSDKTIYSFNIEEINSELIIKPSSIIRQIVEDKANAISVSIIAQRFHNTIIAISTEICKKLREIYQINEVALSGGVFQNSYLLRGLLKSLEKEDFKVYTHSIIPSNDGGVSIGQIVIANENLK